MIINCPIHGKQQGHEMTNEVYTAYMENKKINLERLIFHFYDLETGVEQLKSSKEFWQWLKPEMDETYFNRYVDKYLNYPKGACSVCFNNYLDSLNIIPKVIDVYITKDGTS